MICLTLRVLPTPGSVPFLVPVPVLDTGQRVTGERDWGRDVHGLVRGQPQHWTRDMASPKPGRLPIVPVCMCVCTYTHVCMAGACLHLGMDLLGQTGSQTCLLH